MKKFEITVFVIWVLSVLFMPALIIMFIWGVDTILVEKMLLTNMVVFIVSAVIVGVLGNIKNT